MYSIKILLPMVPNNCKPIFGGFISNSDTSKTIYITRYSTNNALELIDHKVTGVSLIYGYCKCCRKVSKVEKQQTYFELDQHVNPQVIQLTINGVQIDLNNCIIMMYDFKLLQNSETICESSDTFYKLQTLIENKCVPLVNQSICEETVFTKPQWLLSSMFCQHMINYINLLKWLIVSFIYERKVKLKQGNLILAIVLDLILGYLLLELLRQDKKELRIMLMNVLEKLVNSLYSLLKWLMGAPAGLKLNNAFNKMLGKYFLYHIQLWWLFLDVSGEKLDTVLHMYHYLGLLGFTFQAALISDMICIATFHSYCIYVYAARLFNIQISGLIALLRLFVGRKFNPLRGGIDSCEYTNQELFVGTVAFTVLLLLLPTTAMYYTVFTLFRLLSLVAQFLLAKSIHLVQTLPLYVTFLWLTKSSKVAGNILIEVVNKNGGQLILEVKLFSKSIHELIETYKPPVEVPSQVVWSNLLSNIFTGKQII